MLDLVESMNCSSDLFAEDFFGGMETAPKKPDGPKFKAAQVPKKPRSA